MVKPKSHRSHKSQAGKQKKSPKHQKIAKQIALLNYWFSMASSHPCIWMGALMTPHGFFKTSTWSFLEPSALFSAFFFSGVPSPMTHRSSKPIPLDLFLETPPAGAEIAGPRPWHVRRKSTTWICNSQAGTFPLFVVWDSPNAMTNFDLNLFLRLSGRN